jgi:BirA family biotin operon repressor/biotin-[acetyl-CoA-carboxylase] ligase
MPSGFFSNIKILQCGTVASTNVLAWNRLKTGSAGHGNIFQADYQLSGKGQAETAWYASAGCNLLCSLVIKDQPIKAVDLPKVNMLLAMAVYGVVNKTFPGRTHIKWPNDIMVDGHKIAGLLIETTLQGAYVKEIVCGIGLNINEPNFPEYLPNACSYFTLTGQYFNIEDILAQLVEEFDHQLSRLVNLEFKHIKYEYDKRLFGFNELRNFKVFNQTINGKIAGISASGQLILEAGNQLLYFNNKEIQFDFS